MSETHEPGGHERPGTEREVIGGEKEPAPPERSPDAPTGEVRRAGDVGGGHIDEDEAKRGGALGGVHRAEAADGPGGRDQDATPDAEAAGGREALGDKARPLDT